MKWWPVVLRQWRRLLALACLTVGGGFAVSGWWRAWSFAPEVVVCPIQSAVKQSSFAEGELIEVDLAGAVMKPGVYQLATTSRLIEALEAAGGIDTSQADPEFISQELNLAAELTDGQKVRIPRQGDLVQSQNNSPEKPISENLISINNGSSAALESLPQIGAKRADDIIANRPYQTIEELVSKQIISQNLFDEIKELITL